MNNSRETYAPAMREHTYYVYIMASRKRVLYIGITSQLRERVAQHKRGSYPGFSSNYRCNRLVYSEVFTRVQAAISREKQLKGGAEIRNCCSSLSRTQPGLMYRSSGPRARETT